MGKSRLPVLGRLKMSGRGKNMAVLAGGLLLLALVAEVSASSAETGEELLSKLREADAKFLDDITIEALVLDPCPTSTTAGSGDAPWLHRVEVTHQGEVWASWAVFDESMPPPKCDLSRGIPAR